MAEVKFKSTVSDMWRERILDGAALVFTEKGFNKATTKQIAAAAGVGEGTIYNHFQNKRDLLFALLENIATDPIKDILLNDAQEEPVDFFRLVIQDRMKFMQTYGHLLASIMTEIFVDPELSQELYKKIFEPSYKLLENYFEKQIELGNIRAINPFVVGNGFIGSVLLNTLFMNIEGNQSGKKISQEEITEELINWFMSGLQIN